MYDFLKGIYDGTGQAAQVEMFASLQEEGSLFREIKIITQVNINLSGIGLDLAEIGIICSVQGQIRGYAILGSQTDIALVLICFQLTLVSGLLMAVGHCR